MQESGIFKHAVLLPSGERGAYLDQACGTNAALRLEVESLLKAHDQPGEFMHRPPIADATTTFGPGPERPGMRIGPYKLLQFLGEGGMGTVFLAEQTEPVRRMVALKIIKPGMDSSQVLARFEAERQALALMDHPNIAKVLDAGSTGEPSRVSDRVSPDEDTRRLTPLGSPRPYFVMELVKGVPITEFCDKNKLSTRQRLELFIPVCQAIQHAHMKGIIHRDVKPSNVLIALYDGKPVPKVIDFGVAKAMAEPLTQRTLFTQIGQIVGTFEYMSPEQATLNQLDIDTRSDIYSLGVLLYELLTGCTPIDKERLRTLALDQMLRTIREEEPLRPSAKVSSAAGALAMAAAYRGGDSHNLVSQLRGELDWIVMKCLEKERDRRFVTAGSLADDIERYLRDEQVQACPPTLGYRTQKYVRRHKTFISTMSTVAALLLIGIVTTSWQAVRATRAEEQALTALKNEEKARQREAELRNVAMAAAAEAKENERKAIMAGEDAETERRKALIKEKEADLQRQKAVDNATKAEWGLYASHIASAQREWETDNVSLLNHYLNLSRPDFRGWEHDYLYTLANRYQQTLPGPTKHAGMFHLAFSADDKRLAIAGPGASRGNDVAELQVLDLASGKVVLTLKDTWGYVAFSPDGTRLASSWDHAEIGNPNNPFLKEKGKVRVSDAVSGKEIFSLHGHTGRIQCIVFSPDGKRLASASTDGVKLWDMESGKELRTLVHPGVGNWPDRERPVGVRAIAFSPDGKLLASAGQRSAKVWDVASGEERMTFEEHTDIIGKVAFSPDGKRLAFAFVPADSAELGLVKVWDLTTGQEVNAFKGRAGLLSFTPDGKRMFSARNGTVKVWELADGQEVFTLRGPSGRVAMSHDGKRVASVAPDGVRIWNLANSQDCLTITGNHQRIARSLAFSPDSIYLAGPSSDHTAKLWEAASGREIRTLKGHTDLVAGVAFSPNGKLLATSSWDKTLKLWDAASGQEIRTIPGPTRKVVRIVFSPDGNYLAGAESSDEGGGLPSVRVWELASGKEVVIILRSGNALAFSPDGKSLATQFAGVVRVVDMPSGREIMTGNGHTAAAPSVVFSPDGKRLASASRDMTVKLWDVTNGQEIMTIKGHRSQVLSVAFSPDGKRLASGSVDNTVKIWDAATGQEVFILKGHTAPVPCVTFSPDGKRLASASSDFTIKIWDASKSMQQAGQ